MKYDRTLSARIFVLWPLLLPLLLFLPGLADFPYPSLDAAFSDVTITHYPNAVYLKRAIAEFGTIPLWSPTILSGYPFAANPLSGLWYLPGWFALVFPLPLGFNILAALHILWGGVGMYYLLGSEGLSHRSRLLGALAFEMMPKVIAHYGAGHLTLTYAVPWTPWLLFAAQVTGFKQGLRKWLLNPGVILAIIFLADPRWAIFSGLVWISYYAYSHIMSLNSLPSTFSRPRMSSNILHLFSQTAIALLLSSPLLIPLLEFTKLSTRADLSTGEVFGFSLPPAKLLGLIVPDFGGPHEWILYPGGAVLVLGLVAILEPNRSKQKRYWIILTPLTLLFALGSNLPLLLMLGKVPGFNLLRVPPRALFLTGMAVAVLAGHGGEILLNSVKIQNRHLINLGMAALLFTSVILTSGFAILTKEVPINMVWGSAVILVTLISAWGIMAFRIPKDYWYLIILSLGILDLGLMNSSVLSFRPRIDVLMEQHSVSEYFENRTSIYRLYSPSYSLPQHIAADRSLELADGVDPLQLSEYTGFMDAAAGVPRNGYSVTVPPFYEGQPSIDNATFLPDPALLGLLNVRYVVSEFDLSINELNFQEKIGETRIYENLRALPRAWVQPTGDDGEISIHPVEKLDWSPNRIGIIAKGPGMLVLSEIAYPGWLVSVDGESGSAVKVYNILRGVQLDSGRHEIVFSFHPFSVYLGIAGFILGIGLLILVAKRNKL